MKIDSNRVRCFLCLVALLFHLPGCSEESAQQKENPASTIQSRAEVKLHIVVLDDLGIAKALKLLRGEWNERTGGQLQIQDMSLEGYQFNDPTPCDLIIYPSKYLGEFIAKSTFRKVSKTFLANEDFGEGDLLPLVRSRVLRFGDDVFALPLGESPLLLSWKGLETGQLIPASWKECDALPIRYEIADEIEYPNAVKFLVRAIGYASHPSRTAVLFDPETMHPRISSPPFVRALDEIIAQQKKASDSIVCALTTRQGLSNLQDGNIPLRLSAIPKADETYNYSREIWEANDAESAPTFLGFSGRLMSVTRASKNAASAYKLLEWLATGEPATSLSQRSKTTVWYRRSQVPQASRWFPEGKRNANAVDQITQLISGERCFQLPRIARLDQYLQSLETSISQALSGKIDSQQALQVTVESWEGITDAQGRDLQLNLYRKHLGYTE